MHGAAIDVEIDYGTPALVNPPDLVTLAREAARHCVGDAKMRELSIANMGGEDFSYYLEQTPGCYVRFGGHAQGTEAFPAHSSRFDFDEGALEIGAAYFHRLALLAGQMICDHASTRTIPNAETLTAEADT